MARQINLINPALRKTRDALSALPLAAAAIALVVVLAGGMVAAHLLAAKRHAEAEVAAASLKQAQDAFVAVTRQVASRKADPRLAAQLEQAKAQVKRQQEVLVSLDSGTVGNTQGFSEYLRGFARQVPQGLWLTGFTIGAGGHDMELRGRMLSPTLLTEYVRRLNAESAFRGLSFSGLEIKTPRAEASAAPTASPPQAYSEFVLGTAAPGERQ